MYSPCRFPINDYFTRAGVEQDMIEDTVWIDKLQSRRDFRAELATMASDYSAKLQAIKDNEVAQAEREKQEEEERNIQALERQKKSMHCGGTREWVLIYHLY